MWESSDLSKFTNDDYIDKKSKRPKIGLWERLVSIFQCWIKKVSLQRRLRTRC